MEFRNGYNIKPKEILRSGQVIFTDGTDDATPNQSACEAYGYTYDTSTGTCRAYTYSMGTQKAISNESNFIKGTRNFTETATTNTMIMGQGNVTKGDNRSNIIIGSSNEIENGINNAIVFGTKANAMNDNSIVLGGNQGTDILGERQAIHLMYGTQTTQGSETDSFLNNLTGSYFQPPENSIFYFHADVIAVRVGHSGDGDPPQGSVGDYASWVERGVLINQSGTLSVNREKDPIKSNGVVTDWRPRSDVSGSNFIIMVRGETNVTIEWNCYVRMTQIQTSVAL
tara:strand:- start:60 stop:911 length:852 start_codon:yes stop_codon:yes gene_type:complete